MFSSETYSIEDCKFYDNTSSDKSNNYTTNSNIALSFDTDHYVAVSSVGNNVSSNFYGLLKPNIAFSNDIIIECDIKQTVTSTATYGISIVNNTGVSTTNVSKYYQLSNYNGNKGLTTNPWTEKRTTGSLSNDTWYHFKLTITNGSGTGEIKQGNTTVYNDSLSYSQFSSLAYICLTASQYPNTIQFKNFKVKPL